MILEQFHILTIILGILIIFPFILGLLYWRNTKSNEDKELYDKPINNNPPALINSFFGNGINKRVGDINIESFYLSLLDLINRNYVSVKIVSKKNKSDLKEGKVLDKIILNLNKSSADKLAPFEKNVLKCLDALECKGSIDILNTKGLVYKRLKVSTFQKNYDAWMKNFYEDYVKDNKLNFFNTKLDKFLKIYGYFLVVMFIVASVFSYFEGFYLNIILSILVGILGVYLIRNSFNLLGLTKEAKENKHKWDLFKNYYNKNLHDSSVPQEVLDEGINYLPYLLAMGLSKSLLLNKFSEANDITDAYLFLKYGEYSLIRDIVRDFLAADGSFDPKYYNTSGNFVPGFGL
jgi:hypothetical protein